MSGVLLLSAGGYRSGSTYLYNLVGEYAERLRCGQRIGYVEPDIVPLLGRVWSIVDAVGFAVGKSHDAPGTTPGAEAWAPLVADGRVLPVCTVRDWRDVLHSFGRKFGGTPDEVLASRRWRINLDNLRWWLAAGAEVVRYERLHADPSAVLARLADLGSLPFDRHVAAAAADAVAPAPTTAETDARPPDEVDERTLLHGDHLADPEGGGWQRYDPALLARLRPRLEPLLAAYGYEW